MTLARREAAPEIAPGTAPDPEPAEPPEPEPRTGTVLAVAWTELPPSIEALTLPGAPSFLLQTAQHRLEAAGVALRLSGPEALSLAQRAHLRSRVPLPFQLPGPFVAVLPFSEAPGHAFRGLPATAAIAPALMLVRGPEGSFLVALCGDGAAPDALGRAETQLAAALGKLEPRRAPPAPVRPRVLPDPEAKQRWVALVRRALQGIAAGELSKVVLARALEVELAAPPDPRALCDSLARRFPTCRTFWLQGEGAAFAGASPETLAVLEGDRLSCDALAGTSAPGAALLQIDKELREHRSVVDGLRATLLPLAGTPAAIEAAATPALLRLANVDHLHTEVRARLRPGVGIAEVVAALHPTAAVAGAPREASLRFIAAHEGLDRGLYAGLVGLVGPARSELHVALRSALLRGNSARLFVGAGIVRGSDPDAEWEETALKAQAMLGALGAVP